TVEAAVSGKGGDSSVSSAVAVPVAVAFCSIERAGPSSTSAPIIEGPLYELVSRSSCNEATGCDAVDGGGGSGLVAVEAPCSLFLRASEGRPVAAGPEAGPEAGRAGVPEAGPVLAGAGETVPGPPPPAMRAINCPIWSRSS